MAVKLRDMVDLAREFRDVDDFDAKQGIAFFKETGLVFEENERFFSLVIEPAIARTALSSKST